MTFFRNVYASLKTGAWFVLFLAIITAAVAACAGIGGFYLGLEPLSCFVGAAIGSVLTGTCIRIILALKKEPDKDSL